MLNSRSQPREGAPLPTELKSNFASAQSGRQDKFQMWKFLKRANGPVTGGSRYHNCNIWWNFGPDTFHVFSIGRHHCGHLKQHNAVQLSHHKFRMGNPCNTRTGNPLKWLTNRLCQCFCSLKTSFTQPQLEILHLKVCKCATKQRKLTCGSSKSHDYLCVKDIHCV